MRVIVYPGTKQAYEGDLASVMTPRSYAWGDKPIPVVLGNLIARLVERDVLTLADCQALGAPHMEPAE